MRKIFGKQRPSPAPLTTCYCSCECGTQVFGVRLCSDCASGHPSRLPYDQSDEFALPPLTGPDPFELPELPPHLR